MKRMTACKTLFLLSTALFVLFSFQIINSVGASSMMWNQTYGSGMELAYSLVATSDGGYALAGVTSGFLDDQYNMNAWLVKTDAYCNIVWNQTYGGAGDEQAFSLVETSDRGYAIAGYTTSSYAGPSDFWLVKTDENGIIPEFPSWIILPLFLTATLVLAIYRNKLSKTSNQHSY